MSPKRLMVFASVFGGNVTGDAGREEIVIGFVGGFVKRDDMHHPEVQLAARLHKLDRYGVHAEVFENRERERSIPQNSTTAGR